MSGDRTHRRADREASSETRFASSPQPPGSPRESLPSDSILGRVLEETIGEDAGPMTPEEMEALRAVARRYHQEPFDLEPVGIALVESLLVLRLPDFQPNETKWHNMARQIATAFLESPPARSRLERFWKRQVASI
jgi:hypothetical protein